MVKLSFVVFLLVAYWFAFVIIILFCNNNTVNENVV